MSDRPDAAGEESKLPESTTTHTSIDGGPAGVTREPIESAAHRFDAGVGEKVGPRFAPMTRDAGGGASRDEVTPTLSIVSSVSNGEVPLTVSLNARIPLSLASGQSQIVWTIDGKQSGDSPDLDASFDQPGCHYIKLEVSNGGDRSQAESTIVAYPAGSDVGMATITTRPLDHAILPRDRALGTGAAHFEGTVTPGSYAEVVAQLWRGTDQLARVSTQICDDKTEHYELDVPVPSDLTAFDITVSLNRGAETHELGRVVDLLAGDGYLINGQSNAVAAQIAADNDPSIEENTSQFIRTLATNNDDPSSSEWLVAEGPKVTDAHVGQWPLRMAAKLSREHRVPIALFNGGEGGQPLSYFSRNDMNPTDAATNYGRLLGRVQTAGFAKSLRAVFWYQGEADANSMTWGMGFRNLYATWLQDYSGVERYYMTQVHTGCTGDLRYVQEDQRRLPDELLHMGLMSTNGLDAQDSCHFFYVGGYREIGDRYAALVDRDLYGVEAMHVEPPNIHVASLSSDGKALFIVVRDTSAQLVFQPGAEANFVVTVDGATHSVTGGATNGCWLTLYLDSAISGNTITVSYLAHAEAGPWVIDSTSNIGLLVFADFPVMK